MTTDLGVLGLMAGIGLLLVYVGLGRRHASLEAEMARYDPAAVLAVTGQLAPAATRDPRLGFGLAIDRLMSRQAGSVTRDQDLAVTGRTLERHAIVLATAVMAGVALPAVLFVLSQAIGVRLPPLALVLGCAAGVASGLVAPRLELRRSAEGARDRFLRAFSSWLELVALAQAGGMGLESALEAASGISTESSFARIHRCLERSRHSATTPWEEIGRLGNEIGVEQLGELAASLGLAGTEGARIRSSLQAKSAALRRRQLSEAQARANSMTERLFLPSIVLMLGFMIFLMYPAGISISRVL